MVTVMVCEIVFGIAASMIVAWFSRHREFRADAGSAQLLGSPQPMVKALARLGGVRARPSAGSRWRRWAFQRQARFPAPCSRPIRRSSSALPRCATCVDRGNSTRTRGRRREASALYSMSQFFQIHPENPQPRLIRQAAQIIHAGGIVALPTDSCYALVVPARRQGGGGAPAPHPRHRREASPDAAVPRPVRDRRCTRGSTIAQLPAAQGGHAGRLYLHPGGDARSAAPAERTRRARPSACGCRTTRSRRRCWKNWASRCWAPR